MRFKYSTTSPIQNEYDSLPRVLLVLYDETQKVEALGLVDSGATVNILPYDLGSQLNKKWDDRKATIQLAGNLGNFPAIPVSIWAQIGDYSPVKLVFAWTKAPNAPLILGQTNFFMEFDVCFYRSKLEFEVKPKI